jgi:exopolyphosphatase/pppGpp-phosphohydrolase
MIDMKPLHQSLSNARERYQSHNDSIEPEGERLARRRREQLRHAKTFLELFGEKCSGNPRRPVTAAELHEMGRIVLMVVSDLLERP